MFCSRSLNSSLNHIQKRAVSLIYDDRMHSFQDIFEMADENLSLKILRISGMQNL